MNRFKEYIHASQHVGMGCGPIETCAVCKAMGLGDAATSMAEAGHITFDFGMQDILKIATVATISTIVAETFIKPFLIPSIKSFLGEKAKSNPAFVKGKKGHKVWNQAKRQARKYLKGAAKSRQYAYANKIYHQRMGLL